MRAIWLDEYGPAESLVEKNLPKPEPGPNEVLTRVMAAAVNPVDCQGRRGDFPDWYPAPCVLGLDVAGVVEAVGAGVTRFKPGDEVYYMAAIGTQGTYAEYHLAEEYLVAPKPACLSFAEAAAVPLVGQTAWTALVERGALGVGETVLINAGAGGVGHIAVQIAKAAGAYVFATCSARNIDFVRSLGADRVIDYGKEDIAAVITDEAGGVDLVYESMGGDAIERAFPLVRENGRVVSVHVQDQPQNLLGGFLNNASLHLVVLRPSGARLVELSKLATRGLLRPEIHASFPLAELPAAHKLVEAGGFRGKVVIEVAT
jgi:NADPH2:quinone reductase